MIQVIERIIVVSLNNGLRLLYLHDRMKTITVLVVDNDHRNNLVKFEKDSPFYFWVFEWQSWAFLPIEINGNLYFTQNWYGETFQKFTHNFICEKVNISDKIIKSN